MPSGWVKLQKLECEIDHQNMKIAEAGKTNGSLFDPSSLGLREAWVQNQSWQFDTPQI